eukprot:CAMPEP_0204652458 /NCGR_PEP_ID=MMETSP0718-20130828/14559_1 /ASSEMBLY_ACC=CAM_ASM_000674 /TAXON_ID=230516 /ORGANISM="Chaetoceros curvisetus" /LENGTH=532 /DNA_ID=CAMNT_0051676415 /DNA_START=288 /DNA_END=1886 /DNA_ORIENTATION=+
MMENKRSHNGMRPTHRCKWIGAYPDSHYSKQDSMCREISVSDIEKVVLTSLFIDSCPARKNSSSDESHDESHSVLTDEMLLSTPFSHPLDKKVKIREANYDLFKKSEDLSHIKEQETIKKDHKQPIKSQSERPPFVWRRKGTIGKAKEQEHECTRRNSIEGRVSPRLISLRDRCETESSNGIKTDMEVRNEDLDRFSSTSLSSRDENEVPQFDSWQVLNDEYAQDFGFDYRPDVDATANDDEQKVPSFQILGTSADDATAQPHVLSPPLMESLLNFVPEALSCENYWLKYSLVRDGASLDTLKNYTHATPQTIIAILTMSGDIFGSFTSSPWHTENNFFGNGESFVWKMRHNRMEPCYSLYEQAQLESEVEIYPFSSLNNCVQLCTHDMIGVGAGEITDHENDEYKSIEKFYSREQRRLQGFAFVVHEDLLTGTTSPSATFCSPKLVDDEGGMFQIRNIEVWTFTACSNVQDAEQMEMRKFLSKEPSTRSTPRSKSSSSSHQELSQRMFFRRLGEIDEGEIERGCWARSSLH